MRDGEPSFGAWLTIPGLNVAEIMAGMGYDWIFIDAGALLEDESATLMLPAANQVYLVGRTGSTDAADIQETMEILDTVRDRIAGGVLTFSRT